MPCLRHRSLADTPAACSFKTLMICSSVNLLLRIVRLLGGEQNPNLKSGAFEGSRSLSPTSMCAAWEHFPQKAIFQTAFAERPRARRCYGKCQGPVTLP